MLKRLKSLTIEKRSTRVRQVQSKRQSSGKQIASFLGNTSTTITNCVLCKNDKHPLYVCPKFKSLSHDQMVATLKEHSVCMNCLRPGHYMKQCKSLHHCHKCQKPHHTLLHVERVETENTSSTQHVVPISSSIASGISSDLLLMTCRVRVEAPNGYTIEARALLDGAPQRLRNFDKTLICKTLDLPFGRY